MKMKRRRKADMSKYSDGRFNQDQLKEIRLSIERMMSPAHIECVANPNYSAEHMHCMRVAYEMYDYPDWDKFDTYQQYQIMMGIEHDLDEHYYASLDFTWEQMEKIRLAMEDGIRVFLFADPSFGASQLDQIIDGIKLGVNITEYADPVYDAEQMRELKNALLEGEDISQFNDYSYSAQQMAEIRYAMKNGISVADYTPDVSVETMKARTAEWFGFWEKMEEINLQQSKEKNICIDEI